ncbi:MAG: peptidase U32 family protein [Bacteroidota bacterium]
MKNHIELLAPGGDIESIKAAVLAGADAVYCGLDRFNARNRAANISFDDLNGILRFAHTYNCQVFLTLNIIVVDSEIPALFNLLNKLVNTSIDGIIVQDLGLFYILSRYFKGLKIHASTQLTTHNEGQVRFLSKLNASRVNLSRELNISEIKALTDVAHENNILTEVFVHGSNCISFSGICYMSSLHGGNSGNRGRCSQPCRDQYETTAVGKDFPLNLKDNSAFSDLRQLDDAGVDSLKIEGRIKKFHYVYTVVEAWRKQLDSFYNQDDLITDKSALYRVFNRDFSNAFLQGNIGSDMFIDNPRDHSAMYLSGLNGSSTEEKLEKAKGDIYDERTEIIFNVENKINQLSIAKVPLRLGISGQCGTRLEVRVQTSGKSFSVLSETNLSDAGKEELNYEMLLKRLKAVNDTEYFIELLDLENLQSGVYLPFKELTSIKRKLLFILNDSREFIDPIEVPGIKKHHKQAVQASLSVLISDEKDLNLCKNNHTAYFQLPNCFKNESAHFIDLFKKYDQLTPWFPAVLIGEDYLAVVDFLHQLQPASIVTENTGIAYEAYKAGIPWIAGPSLNLVNSYSLLCLKENFNCSGAFISNEISKLQVKGIKCPENFRLYYSIYHPIVLMTSRLCLFHQVTGCEKNRIDDSCIPFCEKDSSITNLKRETFFIEKTKGNYHRIYNEINYLNTDINNDFPGFFSCFLIDLRDIKTNTNYEIDKKGIITLFENLLNGEADSKEELKRSFHPTTNTQYRAGI